MDTQFLNLPQGSSIFSQNYRVSELQNRRRFRISSTSASAIGDFNGDGFDDWQASVSGYFPDRYNADSYSYETRNRTYLIFGQQSRDRSPQDLSKLPESQALRLDGLGDRAVNITALGDVNGDGFDDIVVQQRHSQHDSQHVIFGGSDINPATPLSQLNGEDGFEIIRHEEDDQFNILPAGDFNGDGLDDILVSGNYDNGYGYILSHIIFGRDSGFKAQLDLNNLRQTQGLTFQSGSAYYHTGSAQGIGDVNGDGFDDIVFDSYDVEYIDYNYLGYVDQYIIFGNAETSRTPLNPKAGLRLSRRADLTNIGDIDGDGQDDFKDTHRIYLSPEDFTNLPRRLDGNNGFRIQVEPTDQLQITTAGDINQDGLDDLLINHATRTGLEFQDAYILFGQAEGFARTIRLERLTPKQGFAVNLGPDSLQGSLHALGDINGDGFDDIFADQASQSVEVILGQSNSYPLETREVEGVTRSVDRDQSNTLYGGFGNDRLFGSASNDTVFALSGNDTIKARGGDDRLYGQRGKDQLLGGKGDDILVGGVSKDTLTGGKGEDKFYWASPNHGVDEITDFVSGEDHLVMRKFGFGGLSRGELKEENFIIGSQATTADHRFIYQARTGALFYDSDGVGGEAAIKLAKLTNLPDLTHQDIQIGRL